MTSIDIKFPVTLSDTSTPSNGKLTCQQLQVASSDVTTALTTAGSVATGNAGFVTGGTVFAALPSSLEKVTSTVSNGTYTTTLGSTASGDYNIVIDDSNGIKFNLGSTNILLIT